MGRLAHRSRRRRACCQRRQHSPEPQVCQRWRHRVAGGPPVEEAVLPPVLVQPHPYLTAGKDLRQSSDTLSDAHPTPTPLRMISGVQRRRCLHCKGLCRVNQSAWPVHLLGGCTIPRKSSIAPVLVATVLVAAAVRTGACGCNSVCIRFMMDYNIRCSAALLRILPKNSQNFLTDR